MAESGASNPVHEAVRPDYIPKADYVSRDFLELEKARLWPRAWQVACREEELPTVGSYLTYDIAEDTIVVVRVGEDRIKAFFNVCQHRGRQLVTGCGALRQFVCRFHGWRYDLDGKCVQIPSLDDWKGVLSEDQVHLRELKVDTWGGFVFVNMDPAAEPLRDYLAPIVDVLDPFEFEKMRFRWYVTIEVDCNWKVGLEAFDEAYHVSSTHPQYTVSMDTTTIGVPMGRHGMFRRALAESAVGPAHPDLGDRENDVRKGLIHFLRLQSHETNAIYTRRDYQAATRLLTEVSPDVTAAEALKKAREFQREAAIASGAGWPDLTDEQMREGGVDWHIFPNLVFLLSPSAALFYRARPLGDDPNRCLFDMWSLERYAPGAEPALERKYFKNWRDFPEMPATLVQDFENIPYVQRGVRSRGFDAARPNPVQERVVTHFHQVLRDFMGI